MDDQEIQKVVQDTIALLPEQYSSKLANLEIVVEKSHLMHSSPHIAGKYQFQAASTKEHFADITLPDKIVIYKMSLLQVSRTLDAAREKIKERLFNEFAYYFDIPDEEMNKIKNQEAKPDSLQEPNANPPQPSEPDPLQKPEPDPLQEIKANFHAPQLDRLSEKKF